MKSTILCFMILILLPLLAVEVLAQCTCARQYKDQPAMVEFGVSDVVFEGRVISVKKSELDKVNNTYTVIAEFEVKQLWKGDADQTVTITNAIRGCINGFEVDEEWLVYAYKSPNGKLGSGCCCTRTKVLSKASNDLREFIERGIEPKQVQSKKP